jgi:hypothetical protein
MTRSTWTMERIARSLHTYQVTAESLPSSGASA